MSNPSARQGPLDPEPTASSHFCSELSGPRSHHSLAVLLSPSFCFFLPQFLVHMKANRNFSVTPHSIAENS